MLVGQVTCSHGPCNREGFQRQHARASEEEEDAARMPAWLGRRVPGRAGVRACSKDQGRAVGGTGRERGEARAGEHGGAPDTLQASWGDGTRQKSGGYRGHSTGRMGTSLVFQWLRLCASSGRDMGSIPGRGTNIPPAMPSQYKRKKKNDQKKKRMNRLCVCEAESLGN